MLGRSPKIALIGISALAVVLTAGLSATRAGEASLDAEIGLPRRVIEDAAVWARYVDDACGLSPVFFDGNSIRRGLKTGAHYEPGQLESGEIAYAALAALEDVKFVSQVRNLAQDSQWRSETADRLLSDPDYALDLPGAEDAAGRVSRILLEQGKRVFEAGSAVKQSAYTIQSHAWARGKITDRRQRLALVKKLSEEHQNPAAADEALLIKTVTQVDPPITQASLDDGKAPPVSPTVTRGLALAALAVLGRARNADGSALRTLLSDRQSDQCLKLAKLDLYQCLAVAEPRYEDVYCLGEHALRETGRCIGAAAVTPAPRRTADANQDHIDSLYVRKKYWPSR
jgi:hypothetical protein